MLVAVPALGLNMKAAIISLQLLCVHYTSKLKGTKSWFLPQREISLLFHTQSASASLLDVYGVELAKLSFAAKQVFTRTKQCVCVCVCLIDLC